MFAFFGWLWILAGIVVAFMTLGLAFPVYVPMMGFGMLCLLVSGSGKRHRALERIADHYDDAR